MRIYDANNNAIDLCKFCAPCCEAEAVEEFGAPLDFDCKHPRYADWPGEYHCHDCSAVLTDADG